MCIPIFLFMLHPFFLGNEHGNLLDEENRAFKTTLFTVIINLEMIGFDETRISFNNSKGQSYSPINEKEMTLTFFPLFSI